MENNVKRVREARGMSQTELGRRSGLSRATIWAVESNKNDNLTTKTMVAIAQALDSTVENIFFKPAV